MSEFEKQKFIITKQIRGLCAHCASGVPHRCRVQTIAEEVAKLSGVPLMVNDRFSGLLLADQA
jgi:transcription initiation factor TFIIIB Brf1 subunit/transcription initiation factor TFIIB